MENENFEDLVKNFNRYLIENKHEYLTLFSKLQIQIEGWFRGKLMHYLKEINYELTPDNREIKIPNQGPKERKKVDFKIKINDEWCWIELKHILIGYQKSKDNRFKLLDYFRGYNSFSVTNDIKKLKKVNPDPAYVLCFASVNDNSVIDAGVLEKMINEILNDVKIGADLKAWNFDNDSSCAYFILKVKPDHNPIC